MYRKQRRSLEDQLFWIGLVTAVLGGVLIFIYFKWIPLELKPDICVWEKMFGVYCPGCGGTRAVMALFKGHLLLSLWYHPLVLYAAVIFGAFMVSQAFSKLTKGRFASGLKFHNWYLYGAIGIVIGNCVVKNVLRAVWNITL